jgi:NAD(P)-dependent dehydrogenase (short-subunit alcohol dehydrogenase family)
VAIFARNGEKLDRAAEAIRAVSIKGKGSVVAYQLDVAHHEAVLSTMERAVREFGAPDVLIVNAGIVYADTFANISYHCFDRVIQTNLYGSRNTIAALLPAMMRGGGKIIIIASLAGLIGMFGYSAYSASKFALMGFAQSIRPELKRHAIDVSVVCLPEVDTPLVIEEAKTLPPESRILKDMAGTMSSCDASRAIVRAIEAKRFLVVPGFRAKLTYLSSRVLPGFISRAIMDGLVRVKLEESRKRG